jgi:predicted amidohydrolase YtcJ
LIPDRAEFVIRNARVWTSGRLLPGADSVAVGAGRVLAVGAFAALQALADRETRVLDAQGSTLTPGLVDAHVHLLAWGRSLDELSLASATSVEDAARRLASHAATVPGATPLHGRGWDDNAWERRPHRSALDAVCPGRPVLLHSHDFHSLWVNGAALARAGITRATPDPEGGRIERDANGDPTGILREHAVRLVSALEPAADEAADLAALQRAARRLLALGVTGVHDFEGAYAQRLLRAMVRARGDRVRVLMHLAHEGLEPALALGLESGVGDEWFRIGAVKLFSDGALGSRTASLLEPYDGSDDSGLDLIAPAELKRLVARASHGGLAVAVHAIGDRAVRHTLDACEAAGADLARPALPPRIEHAQLVHADDRARFAALGVAASMQPSHAVSDIDNAERAWSRRLEGAYPWRALLERGTLLAFGSDAPVETPDPSAGLHAAVARTRADGTPLGGWLPAQRLTLDEALSAYTEGPARLAGTDARSGRIAPGADADLVLWRDDLHALDPANLHAARPRLTVLAGRVVHETDSAPRSGERADREEVAR